MSDQVSVFGKVAESLSRNPLGIIALFIVLIYAMAVIVLGLTKDHLELMLPMVWFLVGFPILVLIVFSWLVAYHHTKLYAPKDYQEPGSFIKIAEAINGFDEVRGAGRSPTPDDTNRVFENREVPNEVNDGPEFMESQVVPSTYIPASVSGHADFRNGEYERTRSVFLAHIALPSNKPGQLYDLAIFLVRKRSQGMDFRDVKKAEFFFGKYWGNEVFVGHRDNEGRIGVKTSAYGRPAPRSARRSCPNPTSVQQAVSM